MELFNDGEEIYNIPETLVLVLDKPWAALGAGAREMVNNICAAVKTRPAPVVIHLGPQTLEQTPGLPHKMVVFGLAGPEKPINKVITGNHRLLIPAESAESLSTNPAGKKELWAAIQEMLRTPAPVAET